MPRKPVNFDAVREIGLAMPDVEESTTFGAPALKVGKKLLTCPALHKSADPGSIVVCLSFADRDRLLKEDSAVYYVTDHYVPYPCVVVRLAAIRRTALRELLRDAWRFVIEKAQPLPKARRAKTRRKRRSR